MPELPEVENVARALRRNLVGRRLTDLKVRFKGVLSDSPRIVRRELVGKTLQAVQRHGKYLILRFADGGQRGGSLIRDSDLAEAHWMIHLRMTGQIFILPGYRPDKHVHLTLDFEGLPVYYRDIRKFGRFALVEDGVRPAALSHIGPDMLDVAFAEWYERIAVRRAPVKAVLLDQGIAAGLGNIYADEALFRARIHPETASDSLDRAAGRRLLREAKSVLRLAIRHGGTTYLNFLNFNGKPGHFRRKLRVYKRTGEACPVCGTAIARVVIGGRSSHFCPRCQPRPGAVS